MKELLTEWRKFVNEGAESDEFEDAVRKSVKHYYFVRQFRPHRKNDLLPPVENPWDSIFFALEFIEVGFSIGDLRLTGKLGSYFEVPEAYDMSDLLGDIKDEIHKGLKDLIVGKRIKIKKFNIRDSPAPSKLENEEGTIVDIPAYSGGRGRREFKVSWDNNIPVSEEIRNVYESDFYGTVYFEVMDPPSMEEVREVIERIHPAPFEYWRKK